MYHLLYNIHMIKNNTNLWKIKKLNDYAVVFNSTENIPHSPFLFLSLQFIFLISSFCFYLQCVFDIIYFYGYFILLSFAKPKSKYQIITD